MRGVRAHGANRMTRPCRGASLFSACPCAGPTCSSHQPDPVQSGAGIEGGEPERLRLRLKRNRRACRASTRPTRCGRACWQERWWPCCDPECARVQGPSFAAGRELGAWRRAGPSVHRESVACAGRRRHALRSSRVGVVARRSSRGASGRGSSQSVGKMGSVGYRRRRRRARKEDEAAQQGYLDSSVKSGSDKVSLARQAPSI